MRNTVSHIGSLEIGDDQGKNAGYLKAAIEAAAEMDAAAVVQTGPLFSPGYRRDEVEESLSEFEPVGSDIPVYTVPSASSSIKDSIGDLQSLIGVDIQVLDTSPTYIDDHIALYGLSASEENGVFEELRELEPSSEGCDNILCLNAGLSPVADSPDVNGNRVVLDCNIHLNGVDAILGISTPGPISGKITA